MPGEEEQKKDRSDRDEKKTGGGQSPFDPVTGLLDGVGETIYEIFKGKTFPELLVLLGLGILGGKMVINAAVDVTQPKVGQARHEEFLQNLEKLKDAAKKGYEQFAKVWQELYSHDKGNAQGLNTITVKLLEKAGRSGLADLFKLKTVAAPSSAATPTP